ncbi:MAG: SixA phosphatase family protein [Nocardioides sp.]
MVARTLVLVRHAKSDWSHGLPDRERTLAPRGRRQAPEAGLWIREHLDPLDLAVVSPAVRARSTWELVAAQLGDVATRVDERVYAASAEELLEVVRGLPGRARTVALVGHNPGLEDLLELLTGEWATMPTSALAVLELAGDWADASSGSATLTWSGRPPAPR